ncbi:hypothetical protein KY290_038052 [Solanum tuberosum]|uniref:NLE domain-containing protein n=1 Tax=Solanum tuberosum TaxID=4113 RepID=A0ABQ7TXB9_SOLTU|nr:hypothetical protein KY289_038206 [Solanum tuberosum]KAH0640805.1 hypothetical protein KY285_037391 [Solanum tuberosum]KAH0739347.1 hypothetical protein KY290_038052 [Solanum tuberosum]
MAEMDINGQVEEAARRVQVRFVTKLKPPFKTPPTSIAIPSNLTRLGLSSIVNNLLKAGKDDWNPEPLNFLIDGELVLMSLEENLSAPYVLQEFTHGKQEKVSKTEFKEVLSDILLGMAAGLKRDPIVLLRVDGEDLLEFVKRPAFEPEMLSLYSELELPDGSLKDYIIKAFEKLTVDQGMLPASDSWVMSNVVEPVVESCIGATNEQPVTQETFLAQRLKEQPVIVAHSENTFDESGINRLLSNKFELDKTLDSALKTIPRDRHGKMSKEYLQVALDVLAPSAGLPPIGAVDQMVKEEEFKKLLTEILGSMMLQLEGNPVSVSTNSVVHELLASSSMFLQPPSISEMFKEIITDDLVGKKYSNMMAAILNFREYTPEDMIHFEQQAYFLLSGCAACKAFGGLLILFDHIAGTIHLICYLLITTSVRCVYYYKVGEAEFVIFLQGFMQNMTLFGEIWLYIEMKFSTRRRQLKKKASKSKKT